MKKIHKYPTGAEIPEGAIYMSTVTQTEKNKSGYHRWDKCWLVWHYFLVEVYEETTNDKKV